MKRVLILLVLTLGIAVAPVGSAYGQGGLVAELAAQGWRADEIAAAPDLPTLMSTLSDQEYMTFLYDLISLGMDQQYLMATLPALRRQGVPSSQTCVVTRRVLWDRGVGSNPGNPMIQVLEGAAGCQTFR
jgi:hypothetical protein